ncbi:ABC transporter ATP-binding protein [Mammaliicoccus sciuri]|jgi:putative ABC transport system ATP-binding protein|uniref:Putative hemin import ATP-binding protein HrtA n=2 Tax=Mammaliicoccus sciuri TaxID=1296 RepID=A0AAW5LJX9_MAMSC|nr:MULTISPECIES: ABC transporter ATP-binding protein [Mammaliicoccus]MBG9209236.1 ABC transporter ATP-binding protein [Mammaliicoccus sciuri]MCD8880571.1 ABC transporter ATP-binding protein [Mammaliicoccus sciuri]MCI8457857.1 ABC transporter ATP-binding protein [Mammaliicoccus sciuri]MCQ9302263.1 ABC transporter ATP-binding protein [Mammaliicoccus sciuri]MDT0707915.1 ABC transporter ATP-binding protein [Mammaliicoccus sciuri]
MLAFENVTKSFKDGNRTIEAVKSTNFKLEKGELVAIIGPSGSGKSTLLTMAGALQLPSEGTVSLNGQNINHYNEKQLSKLRLKEIGFILQTSNLIPFLTVQQQFELLKKVKKDVMNEDEHTRLLKQLGLDKILTQLPSEISGGQKQRVAIAKALYTNPSIILADEPTASLDTENAIEVMEILRRETKELNKLCIIVTHDQRLTSYCDKVFKMVDGELKEE